MHTNVQLYETMFSSTIVVQSYYGTKVCIPVAMQLYETMFNIAIVKTCAYT